MKLLEVFESGKVLYHVTHTSKVENIRKKGLLLMQTSNWARMDDGERYGNGEVYAFESKKDAVRWAAKMDWEFNKKMGSGNISIVEFHPGTETWDEDDADPLAHAGGEGAWYKSDKPVRPNMIVQAYPVTNELIKKMLVVGPSN